MTLQRRCIYCGRALADEMFRSIEHVWPKSIGVDRPPEIFVSKSVCDPCNHLCGLFVDGPFSKSWFITNEKLNSDFCFLDPEKPTATSLAYMGQLKDFPVEPGWVCDNWSGPSGEHIYHLRPASEPIWDTYVGGNPKRQKKKSEAGRAYIHLTADDDFWLFVGISSFHKHFTRSRRFCLTSVDSDFDGADVIFPPPDMDDPIVRKDVEYIRGKSSVNIVSSQIDLGFADRFLCKLALGLGSNIIGEEFVLSEYAAILRAGLREASYEKRRALGVQGTAYDLGAKLWVQEAWGYSGGWTIYVSTVGGDLSVSIAHPSGHISAVRVSKNIEIREDLLRRYNEGEIYVAVPSVGKFIGPYSLGAYLSHRHGGSPIAELSRIDQLKMPFGALPSRRRPSKDGLGSA
ncbi:HNH endonuclease [Aminobacter sp. BA135]